MPPFEWSNASENGQSIGGFSAMDIFCQPSWDDVETIVFVVVPEWIPWLYEYTAYVDALSPQIESRWTGRLCRCTHPSGTAHRSGNATQLMLAESTPQGGVRVGEGNSSFGLRLMDTPLVNSSTVGLCCPTLGYAGHRYADCPWRRASSLRRDRAGARCRLE